MYAVAKVIALVLADVNHLGVPPSHKLNHGAAISAQRVNHPIRVALERHLDPVRIDLSRVMADHDDRLIHHVLPNVDGLYKASGCPIVIAFQREPLTWHHRLLDEYPDDFWLWF